MSGWTLGLGAPWAGAAGLAVALAAAALGLPRLGAALPRARRHLARAGLGLALVAAAVALADPWLGLPVDRLTVIVVEDVSRSMDAAGADGALATLAGERAGDDRLGHVVFAAEAATVRPPAARPLPGAAVEAPVARDGTDLEAGVRRALAELGPGDPARLVLVSDGLATAGDPRRAAALAAARGVPVDVVPRGGPPRPERAVVRVDVAPAAGAPGEPIEVRVLTRASAAGPVRLRVLRDGVTLGLAEVELAAGLDVFRVRDAVPPDAAGLVRYEARLEPPEAGGDALGAPENDAAAALLRVAGASRALVLAEPPVAGEAVRGALVEAGFDVPPVRATPPDGVEAFAAYDLVALVDVEARRFSRQGIADLASAVSDLGVGLLMAGGRGSFGLGGWARTPVEDVLPAHLDLRRRRDRASLAMVFAIDVSGSMGVEVPGAGVRKIDLANEAAARSAALLSATDRVGVAHVDTEAHWTLPMVAVDDPGAVEAAVRQADAGGGGILVDVALDAAYRALAREATQLRHLLLFSDGSDSENLAGARAQVAEAARRERITTSVVSMGAGPDTPELEALTRAGGGRFYLVEDLTELPRVFTQETVAATRAALVQAPTTAVPVAAGPVLDAVDWAAAPALDGFAVVEAKGRAERLLDARSPERDEDDPLLLRWQVGAGRSAVLATGPGVDLGAPWGGWPGLATLVGRLGRDLARPRGGRGARLSLRLDGPGTGVVVLDTDARDVAALEGPPPEARVVGPRGARETVRLVPTGLGRFEGRFDAAAPGPYLVAAGARDGLASGTLVVAPGDELRGGGVDAAGLARLAAWTGGVVREDARGAFADRPPPGLAPRPLWSPLVALSLLALLASVVARRLDVADLTGGRAPDERPGVRRAGQRADVLAGGEARGRGTPAGPPAADTSRAAEAPLAGGPPRPGVSGPRAAPPAPPATLAERLLAERRRRAREDPDR